MRGRGESVRSLTVAIAQLFEFAGDIVGRASLAGRTWAVDGKPSFALPPVDAATDFSRMAKHGEIQKSVSRRREENTYTKARNEG